MEDLSSKQLEILNFLISFQQERGFAPSVREICDAVGLSSTSSVHANLAKLENKGYIHRDPSKSRSIEILKQPVPGEDYNAHTFDDPGTYRSDRSPAYIQRRTPELVSVPILGRVRAGTPILAAQNIEDYYPVPVDYTRGADCYILRVQGESMIEAGIFENDLILVRSQRTASDRDIVVALLGDSVTVKTFYRERNFIRLQPENKHMDPILVKDCQILGKVIALFRVIA